MIEKRHDPRQSPIRPSWCDPHLCTATSETEIGGAHRGAPATYNAEAVPSLEVTASLYQAHAPWLTALFVDIEFTGLDHDFQSISGKAHITADKALELGQFLTEVGQTTVEDYDAQVDACLPAISKEVSGK